MERLCGAGKGRGQQQGAEAQGQSPVRRAELHHRTAPGTGRTQTCQLALQEVAEAQEVVVQNEQEENDGHHENGDVH